MGDEGSDIFRCPPSVGFNIDIFVIIVSLLFRLKTLFIPGSEYMLIPVRFLKTRESPS